MITPTQNNNIDYKLMDINYLKRYEQYNIRMTPQEEYKYNESIISSFVKRQEELKIVIRREETIEMMTDEKLDNLQDKLNKMLELQKQYNTLVSDKQSPITKKYLPLPYDINEIIRNKIKEDGKNKKVEDYIKLVANIYKKELVNKFLNDIQKVFKRRLKFNSNNALGEYDDEIRHIGNKYDELCNLGYCINNEILFGINFKSTFIYNDKNRKLVMELYKDIRCEILVPIKIIVNKLSNARSNDYNDKINTINDIKVLAKNNRFNPNGFKKLCKEILNIFKTHNNILEHIPQDEINDWWVINGQFYCGLNLYQFEIHRLESVRKTMDFLGMEY